MKETYEKIIKQYQLLTNELQKENEVLKKMVFLQDQLIKTLREQCRVSNAILTEVNREQQ